MPEHTADPATLPLLYSFRRCPYAMRARMGLAQSGVRVVLREILLRQKPDHMLQLSPKGTVPVLALPDGQVIAESLDILLWALSQRDPDGWLTPDRQDKAAMLALISAIDGPFKRHLDRYKYATRYEDAEEETERTLAMAALAPLVVRLSEGPQLFGARISLADIAIFPFVRQFANTDKAWFGENAPSCLQGWLEDHVTSDLFAAIFRKWPQWHEGDPTTLFP